MLTRTHTKNARLIQACLVVTALTVAVALPVGGAAQEACPSVLRFDVNGPASDIDPGWTGLAYDNHFVGLTLTMGIGGCAGSTQPSCGTCTLSGPIANGGGATYNNRRCSDKSWITCATTADCTSAGAAGPCRIFFGPPLPYSAGGVGVCVTNEITGAGSGSTHVEGGTIAMSLPYLASVYNGIAVDRPCPRCVAGVCDAGARVGMPCTTNGTSAFFGNVSFDCPPTAGTLIGSLVPSGLDLSTGTSTLPISAASPTCNGAPGKLCACNTCSSNPSVACASNADCSAVGAGTCTGSVGEPRKPNACVDDTAVSGDGSICDDAPPLGDGEGQCPESPITQHCAIETFRSCIGPGDCPAAGDFCTADLRKCFAGYDGFVGDAVTVSGAVDAPVGNVAAPTLAGAFCIPAMGSAAANIAAGFPGPGRMTLPGTISLGDEIASGTVGGGGTVMTDTEADGATAADPIETAVTSPNAGEIIINEQAATGTPPGGFELIGKQVNVTAPAASAASPLILVFRIDASRIPPGEDETTIVVLRNGAPLAECTGAGATPDPCVGARVLLGDGDVELTIRTSAASIWSFLVGDAVLDHFTCYQAGASKGSVKFAGIPNPPGITLLDQFWGVTAAVKKPKYLCAPTNKNNEDPTAPAHPDHLEGYQHKPSAGFPGVANQQVTTQFGTIFVDVKKPSHVLVPTAKSLVTPPPAPAAPAVDHFQCYQVKDLKTPQFQPVSVTLQDQFGAMTALLKKPKFLCAPVDKNGEAPGAETHSAHLLCYQAKQTSLPKFAKQTSLFTNNQFGPETLDAKKPSEVCVPALKNFDACDEVTVIPSGGGTISGSTDGANLGISTLSGICGGGGPERVFAWTPVASGVATVETCGGGTNYDTVIHVREGTCEGAQVACSDDACGAASRVQPTVVAGQTYFIVVDGFGTSQGDFELIVTAPRKRVFATSTLQSGNMGNLAGADAICQARAGAAGLGGTYKAWLSSATTSAAARLTQAAADYALVTGTVVANGWADLTDGTLDAPIDRDEFGAAVSGAVWTNSTTAGAIDAAECLQWTSTTPGHKGQTGLTTATNASWTDDVPFEDCFQTRRLYCFEQ